jgi:hypothetical protein
MPTSLFRDLADYQAHLKNLVAVSQTSNDWTAIKRTQTSRKEATIFAWPFLRFNDGSIMYFNEGVILEQNRIERLKYSYHYERFDAKGQSLFYFRYDRDSQAAEPVIHAECHLHVNQKEPRFKTHVTSFEEVFEFIVAYYYQERKVRSN